jgi:hypothetical protein
MFEELEQLERQLVVQLAEIEKQLAAVRTTRKLLPQKSGGSDEKLAAGTYRSAKFGTVTKAVKGAIAELPAKFTLGQVEEAINKNGHKANIVSIRTAVNRLVGTALHIAEKGAGRRPSTYEKIM